MTKKALLTCNFLHRVSVKVLVLVLIAAPSLGSSVPEDALVLIGVGMSGGWVTDVTISNTAATTANWDSSFRPGYLGPCPIICPGSVNGSLASAGTLTFRLLVGNVTTSYLTPESGPATSLIVQARVFNSSRPTQAIDVPVFRLSTIVALNPRVLVFPGAKRDAVSRTNLVLANIIPFQGQSGPLTLAMEAYSGEGRLLGSETIALQFGETRFLVDVLADLGVASLDLGQIRVTKVAGDGVFWGTMFTTTTDGGVSVSVGAHP